MKKKDFIKYLTEGSKETKEATGASSAGGRSLRAAVLWRHPARDGRARDRFASRVRFR